MTPLLGAHVSIAGGLPRAVDRAAVLGCRTFQVFTRSTGMWRSRPLPRDEVREFRRRAEQAGIVTAVAHANYLINLAATTAPLRTLSLDALHDEIARAHALGLAGVVLHPGAATGRDEAAALDAVAAGLRLALRATRRSPVRIVLEHTAGQGSSLGWRFEHLATILRALDGAPRLAVCLDTCHLHAAGYDLTTGEACAATLASFDALVGFDRLAVLHVNDSKRPLGSRVDRHAHIGEGTIGREAFRRLLTDARLAGRPMILETEKAARGTTVVADPLDARNLATLRALAM